LKHIDLFTGLGGFSLAAQANGIQTVVMGEADEWRRAGLKRAWPGIPIVEDVREFDGTKWAGAFILTAGVPCQPASRAGKQRGAEDDRWLWPEALRVVAEARPRWCLFENPPGIRDVGLDGILADLEALGYEIGILDIPACAVNSPQLRGRYWIVAFSSEAGERGVCGETGGQGRQPMDSGAEGIRPRNGKALRDRSSATNQGDLAHASSGQRTSGTKETGNHPEASATDHYPDRPMQNGHLAHRNEAGRQGGRELGEPATGRKAALDGRHDAPRSCQGDLADTQEERHERAGGAWGRRDGFENGNTSDMDNPTETRCPQAVQTGSGRRERRVQELERGFDAWASYLWTPCADGKVRRTPDDSFGLVDGLPRKILAGLGNSIVWPVAAEIMRAIIQVRRGE